MFKNLIKMEILYMSVGSHGIGEGEFNNPTDVAVDSIGNILVADSGNDRIQKFDKDGNFVSEFGQSGQDNGQFDTILGIEIDDKDNLFVADSENHRIQKFNRDGTFLTSFGEFGSK